MNLESSVRAKFTDISGTKRTEKLLYLQRDLGLALSAAAGPTGAMERLLAAALQIEGIDAGAIYQVDPATGALELVDQQGLPPELVGAISQYGPDSPQSNLVMAGSPVYGQLTELFPLRSETARHRDIFRSVALLPIKADGSDGAVMVLGSLGLACRSYDEIPPHVRHALEVMAAQAAGAISRLKANLVLQEREEKYRLLADNTLDVIWQMDLSTKFTYVNPAIYPMTGFTPEEWIGTRLAAHCPKIEMAKMAAIIARSLKSYRDFKGIILETRFYRKNGEEFPVEVHGKLVLDDRGKPVALQGTTREITERKQAEEELRTYQEQLESLVEVRTAELRERVAEVERLNLALNGLLEELQATNRELRETQTQLLEQEKMAVLGQLAAAVAHELRNPLGAVKNAAYFLNLTLAKPEADIQESLQIIDQEIAVSEGIIKSLLDFANLGQPVRRAVEVRQAAQAAVARLLPPGKEPIEVAYQFEPELPPISADPDQLNQIFERVILNGVQAMLPPYAEQPGGKLVIRATVVDPDWVAVSISDSGIGIPEENLERLFEPLFTTKAKGTGLGLAFVKRLVEGHGGTVAVESQVDRGSTFTVKLPLDRAAGEEGVN